MNRNRLEDLGRLYELLDKALQSPIFFPEGGDVSMDAVELKYLLNRCWEIVSGSEDF